MHSLPHLLQWRTTMTECPTRVWKRAGWLTGLSPRGKLNSGAAATSWLQSDMSAHVLIVVKDETRSCIWRYYVIIRLRWAYCWKMSNSWRMFNKNVVFQHQGMGAAILAFPYSTHYSLTTLLQRLPAASVKLDWIWRHNDVIIGLRWTYCSRMRAIFDGWIDWHRNGLVPAI